MRNKTVEKTRTTAGYALYEQGVPIVEICKRVRVRVVCTWDNGDFGEIETSVDGGPWVNEGPYVLS
jgi:hypothetical protein